MRSDVGLDFGGHWVCVHFPPLRSGWMVGWPVGWLGWLAYYETLELCEVSEDAHGTFSASGLTTRFVAINGQVYRHSPQTDQADTKTLGGAGFASRKYQFGPEPLSLPRAQYRGVILRVLPSQSRLSSGAATSHAGADADAGAESPQRPQTFTLVFKAQLNARPPSRPKIPPSPDPASLSYEAQFTSAPALTASSASSSGSSVPWIDSIASLYSYFSSGLGTSASARSTPINPNHHMHIKEVKIPFDDFIPTYRGRPVHPADPKYKPFDPAGIYEVSLMCRSDFGKQEGEFELVLESIEAWERDGDKNGREGKGKGEGKGRVGCWGWMQGVMGEWTGREGEGRVRLEEAIGEKRG